MNFRPCSPRALESKALAAGAWHLIGFVSGPRDGFVGELSDPVPVRYTPAGTLEVAEPSIAGL